MLKMHKTHKKYRSLIKKKSVSLTSIIMNNLKTIEPFRTFIGSLKKKKACIRQQGHSSFYVDGIFKSEKKHSVAAKEVLH